jgi:surface antigen
VLGDSDLSLAHQSRERALEYAPSGLPVSWRNPGTGDSGSYVAQRAFATNAGQYCRAFRQTVTVKGETREDRGTACRGTDGTWLLAP